LISDFNQADNTRNIFNFGTPIDFHWMLFFLKTTQSASCAKRVENGMQKKRPVMYSLKLLGN